MKTNFVKFIYSFLMLSVLLSCKKDWLDEKTSLNITVPETLKDMQSLLDNYSKLNSGISSSLGVNADDIFYVPDNIFATLAGTHKNSYTWTYKEPYLNGGWHGTYTSILYCNLALEGLAKISPLNTSEQQVWNSVKGNALFHRAFAYYTLSQVWSPPYNPATSATDLSVPIRLESDINIPSKRSTVQETYDLILADLKKAEELLQPNIVFTNRGSKISVYALLARIYLSMEDYINAEKYASECLKLKSTLLDFNKVSVAAGVNQVPQAPIIEKEIIFDHSMDSFSILSPLRGFIVDNFYNSYGSSDLRKSFFFLKNANGTINFRGNYNIGITLFNGLATDEVFLIKAECLARAGNTGDALKALNELLAARYVVASFVPRTAANAQEALILILEERKKELLLRGTRWSDLRRLNRDERFRTTLKRTVLGVEHTLEPNSYKYTFPIPDEVIQFTGMSQTTGW